MKIGLEMAVVLGREEDTGLYNRNRRRRAEPIYYISCFLKTVTKLVIKPGILRLIYDKEIDLDVPHRLVRAPVSDKVHSPRGIIIFHLHAPSLSIREN